MFDKLKSKLRRHKSKGKKDEPKKPAPREPENVTEAPAPTPAPVPAPAPAQTEAPAAPDASATATPSAGKGPSDAEHTPTPAETPKEAETPAKDLWEIALKQLPPAKREKLKSLGLDKLNSGSVESEIEDLVGLVNQKQAECEKKFWRVSIGDNDIVLRNYTTKIVGWLEKAGDIAIQFAPPQASMPWSVIKSLMQIPVIGEEQMGALLGTTESIVRIVSRGQVYEQVYLVNSSEDGGKLSQGLEGALIGIYKTSLDLLADSGSLFSQNTARRTLEAILNPGNVSGGLSSLAAQEDELLRDVQACETRRSAAADDRMIGMLDCLNAPLVRVDENVQKLLDKTDEEERMKLLQKISPLQFGKPHDNVRETRTPGTGEWLLQDGDFRRWEESTSSGIFWLQGSPGTGKTYLTSRVVDLIKNELEDLPRNEGFAYFYCNRNEKDRGDSLAIIRSYVRQLSTSASNPQSVQIKLKELCKKAEESGTTLSFDTCQEQIVTSLNLYTKTTLVIDAFDECDQDSRDKLIEMFNSLLAESKNTLKIYIAGRPDPDVQLQLQEEGRTGVTIQASHNAPDIQRFLDQQLDKLAKKAVFIGRMKGKIVERLLERCQGMFQWASLQVHQITRCRTESNVWKRLDNLPEDLQKAYDEIWNEIESLGEPDSTFVKRAFKWVMAANMPLDSNVLLSAIRVGAQEEGAISSDEIDEQGLLSLCGNFLVIDPESNWRFSHLSVVEYLESAHDWSLPQAHCHIAISCLSFFISAYEQEEFPDVVKEFFDDDTMSPDAEIDYGGGARKYSLHFYAKHNWVVHVHAAQATEDSDLAAHLKTFLGAPHESSAQYKRWFERIQRDGSFDEVIRDTSPFQISGFDGNDITLREIDYSYSETMQWCSELDPPDRPIFAMCRFAFDAILSEWWESPSIDVSETNAQGHNLLTVAAIAGSVPICQRLIEKGTDVNQKLGPFFGSALIAAAYWGHTDVVKCLVQAGANPNIALNTKDFDSWDDYDSDGEVVPKEDDIPHFDWDAPHNGAFDSALTAAVTFNRAEVTKYLVNEANADVHKKLILNGQGTLLEIASTNGNPEIIKCLIHAGADVNKPPRDPAKGRIVDRVLAHGDLSTIRFVIEEAGADLDASAPGQMLNVLGGVAKNKRLDSLKYLVEKCHLDINRGSEWTTPLISAVEGGDLGCVRYLVERGADLHKLSDNEEKSPLIQAVDCDHLDCARYLVEQGADINKPVPRFPEGRILAAALESYYLNEEMVIYFLDHGADVNLSIEGETETLLSVAARRGNVEIVRRMLERGANVNPPNNGPLIGAAESENLKCVQLLLENGADPNLTGKSPLARAASKGWTECVQLLLKGGADVNPASGNPLMEAAAEGHLECVKILLGSGADIHRSASDLHGSVLAAAAYGGSAEITKLILEAGAEVNAQISHKDHGSALCAGVASYNANEAMVRCLLEAGAQVDMLLENGEFPSALAASAHGDLSYSRDGAITKLLIDAGANPNLQLHRGDFGNVLTSIVGVDSLYCDKKPIVKNLLELGADANTKLESGRYPNALAAAASHGDGELIQLLVSHGADVNAQVGDHGSIITSAISSGTCEGVKVLLENGVAANSSLTGDLSVYGSLLTFAAILGQEDIITALIEGGADVNATPVGKYGSALVAAAYFGQKSCAERLVNAGANVNLQLENVRMSTALEAAKAPITKEDYLEVHPKAGERHLNFYCGDTLPEEKVELLEFLEQVNQA
ncbi:unnamed protein product [Penicillium salamii]|uniref:Nephrocystin 3-like N-terminal domain-containing protein n=1 Tax=Penicillium salamii TaxID=1612424 RepID=A0A9W4J9W9_9EURO|nr:unnamed protein product [Penicillium salamii]CAG7986268.1 unnamed protein product [Penicillium salamii]CAG8167749.1 unnamed protein product [Penicillium salamii]CAG8233434.1 unnamed protein product [Penicillium salamii]CAG8244947.1 unnamed protein product [Penicillium salamii]